MLQETAESTDEAPVKRDNIDKYIHIAYDGTNVGAIYVTDVSKEDQVAMGIEVGDGDSPMAMYSGLKFEHGSHYSIPIKTTVAQSLFGGVLKHFMTYSVAGSLPPLSAYVYKRIMHEELKVLQEMYGEAI